MSSNSHFQAPEIVSLYGLNVSPQLIRARIRDQFEKNRYVEDLAVIDLLLHKGRQDYQEVMNCWQQEPHILGILLKEPQRQPQTFMQRFLEGELNCVSRSTLAADRLEPPQGGTSMRSSQQHHCSEQVLIDPPYSPITT